MLLAFGGIALPHHLVVDYNVITSYAIFMLCLALLCFDQIAMRKHRKK